MLDMHHIGAKIGNGLLKKSHQRSRGETCQITLLCAGFSVPYTIDRNPIFFDSFNALPSAADPRDHSDSIARIGGMLRNAARVMFRPAQMVGRVLMDKV